MWKYHTTKLKNYAVQHIDDIVFGVFDAGISKYDSFTIKTFVSSIIIFVKTPLSSLYCVNVLW